VIWRTVVGSGVFAVLAACGGVVEGGERESEPGGNAPKPSATSSSERDDDSSNPEADTELGGCELGRKEDYIKPCAWVAEGRCYDEREMACNCACPRSRTSQCASGFESGPDGHVWVSCD
jgi:hypothetical protein